MAPAGPGAVTGRAGSWPDAWASAAMAVMWPHPGQRETLSPMQKPQSRAAVGAAGSHGVPELSTRRAQILVKELKVLSYSLSPSSLSGEEGVIDTLAQVPTAVPDGEAVPSHPPWVRVAVASELWFGAVP